MHSKITQITPNRPQITPEHTKSSQEQVFGTYLFTDRPHQTILLHCPLPKSGSTSLSKLMGNQTNRLVESISINRLLIDYKKHLISYL